MKQVHYEIHEIEEYPATGPNALDMMRRLPGLVHCLYDTIGKPSYVCIRRAGRDNEKIGGVAETTQVENLHADSFAILDGTDGGTQRDRQARPAAFSQFDQPRPVASGSRCYPSVRRYRSFLRQQVKSLRHEPDPDMGVPRSGQLTADS